MGVERIHALAWGETVQQELNLDQPVAITFVFF